ncbi:hypothetical protein [Actinoplanes sp. NBRC 103695]|uniref:hypothetical protein n=1 Tax=Actinoplanes sp. NBRC 103695 TaxID=3032202 RepID=UPI002555F0B5|nr:hypothetical protein [Actinoplanes sp. NBRC 103695]
MTVVVRAPDDLPGYRAFFEPEGGSRDLAPGDRLTIVMASSGPKTIEVNPFDGGLVLLAPLNIAFDDIMVTDSGGRLVEDIY